MVERKPNETKIVAWLLVAKKLIKFANDETSYKVSDKVIAANDFVKFPLKKGDKVEVGIIEGAVTFLRKQKSETKGQGSEEAYEPTPEEEAPKQAVDTKIDQPAPKPETPKVEAPKSEMVAGLRNLTVFAVATNKKVVKFLEIKDEGWFQIAETIQAQDYTTIGLIAKSKVEVQFNEKTVIAVKKIAVEEPKSTVAAPQVSQDKPSEAKSTKVEPTPPSANTASVATPTVKKTWQPYNSQEAGDRQNSIECQACINSACQVVGMMAANIDPKPTANILNAMIRSIAEENYNLLKELKKK